MKNIILLILLSLTALNAQEFDDNGLPLGYAEKTNKTLAGKNPPKATPKEKDVKFAPIPNALSPKNKYPVKEINAAMDELPAGKYIGKLPADLYLELAKGKEGEHALKLLQKWEKEGLNPLMKFNGKLQYTYGSGTPLVIVKPTELTDIELQEGEKINDILIGDNIRWIITPTVNGTQNGLSQTSHVIVKAKKPNLTTSLIITTNRRTYRLRLVSSAVFQMPLAAFTYPQEKHVNKHKAYLEEIKALEEQRKLVALNAQKSQQERIEALENQLHEKDSLLDKKVITAKRLADPLYLDFLYKIKKTKGRPSWFPANCYNDGQKTYIVMPKTMNANEAPIVLIKDGKNQEIVNYRLVDNKFVVDRVFDKAILLSGVGSLRKEVKITRTNR